MKHISLFSVAALVCAPFLSASAQLATGGTVTTVGPYTIHTFTESGTFTASAALTADILVVGGGGSGGGMGGGGGGGAVIVSSGFSLGAGSYTVTIGAGGIHSGNGYDAGVDGGDTSFGTEFLAAGGKGGHEWYGAGGDCGDGIHHGGASVSGAPGASGGGAGAGGDGVSAVELTCGNGGPGIQNAFQGVARYFGAGGGGGAQGPNVPGSAVSPGAGSGASNGGEIGGSAEANTGSGGGGGGGWAPSAGGNGADGIVVVRYLTAGAGDAPQLTPAVLMGTSQTTVTFKYEIADAGSSLSSCDVYAVFQATEGAVRTNLLANAVSGEQVAEISGLAPGTTYALSLLASNSAGFSTLTDSVSVTTELDDMFRAPGLVQAVLPGTGVTSGTAADGTDLRRELGTVMGIYTWFDWSFTVIPYESPLDGVVTTWVPHSTFLYEGWMYLEAGTTYGFRAKNYYGESIWIDGVQVLWGAWGNDASGSYTCNETGWHDFRCYLWPSDDEVPGGGHCGYPPAYNPTGTADASSWIVLEDPGDGSLFRCAFPGAAGNLLTIRSASKAGTSITTSLDVDLPAGYTLYAGFSTDYEGADESEYTLTLIEAFPQGASDTQIYTVAIPDGANYMRFIALNGNGEALAGSRTLALADVLGVTSDPIATFGGVVETNATSAVFAIDVSALGSGASSWTATVHYGLETQDLVESIVVATGTAASSTNAVLSGLCPASDYCAQVEVSNDCNGQVFSAIFPFHTPTVFAGASTSANGLELTFSGELAPLGEADEVAVQLYTGSTPDDLAPNGDVQPVTLSGGDDLSFAFTVTAASWDDVVYYAFVASDTGSAWTDRSATGFCTTADRAAYTWKPDHATGDWTDAANWTSDREPCRGYPLDPTSSASFDACVPETPVVATVDCSASIASLSLRGASSIVTLQKAATGESALETASLSIGPNNGNVIVFDGISVAVSSDSSSASGSQTGGEFHLRNGASLTYAGSVNFQKPTWHLFVESDSVLTATEIVFGGDWSTLDFTYSVVTVDDGTIVAENMLFEIPANGRTDVYFRGTHPRLDVGSVFGAYWGAKQGDLEFHFNIPQDGYEVSPIDGRDCTAQFNALADGNVADQMIYFSVDDDSPARSGNRTLDVALVDWNPAYGIVKRDRNAFGDIPDPATNYFFYNPDPAEATPTQLLAHIVGRGFTLILLK